MPWTVSERTERVPLRNKRNCWLTLNWSTNPQEEQSKVEKCDHHIDRLWKGQTKYDPTILDCRLSKHLPDIWQNHKIHHRSHEKLESGINSRRKNFCRGKNPKRHLLGRCYFTATICSSNDATQLHSEEDNKFTKLQEKSNHLCFCYTNFLYVFIFCPFFNNTNIIPHSPDDGS